MRLWKSTETEGIAMDQLYEGYVNVLAYGAQPNSFLDDTEAFVQALATGNSVFVPSGVYYVSDTLVMENQNLIGAGTLLTQIVSICTDPVKPIIQAGRSCVLADFLVKYKEGIVTGDEKEGERVAVWASGRNWPMQRGSTIRNIRVEECGTCLYSPQNSLSPFLVAHESLELNEFSYRGIDYRAVHRLGNVYTNIYISSNKPHVDCIIALENDCTEVSMHQISLMHTTCRTAAMRLSGVRSFPISTLHFGDVRVTGPGGALLDIERSSGIIGGLNMCYLPLRDPGLSLVRLGDADYATLEEWEPHGFEDNPFYLRIGVLHACALNDPTIGDYPSEGRGIAPEMVEGFRFFSRRPGSYGEYVVDLEQYNWYTFQDDRQVYKDFACDDEHIRFLRKGILPTCGPASERPTSRLCPGMTTYYDSEAKKKWLWTGEEWI